MIKWQDTGCFYSRTICNGSCSRLISICIHTTSKSWLLRPTQPSSSHILCITGLQAQFDLGRLPVRLLVTPDTFAAPSETSQHHRQPYPMSTQLPVQAIFHDTYAVSLHRQVFLMHVQFPCTGIAQLSMQASQYCRQSFPTSPRSAQDISAQPSITFSHSRHLHSFLCRHPTISSSRFMITPLTCEVNALAWQFCSLEETTPYESGGM